MIKIQKNKAYAQVLEILNHIKLEDYYKLPKEIIRALEVNKDEDTKFKYNKEKDFLEQEMLSETKLILAIFFKRYWATDDQKAKIRTYEVNKIVAIEEEKKKIYPQNVITDKIVEEKYSPKAVINEIKKLSGEITIARLTVKENKEQCKNSEQYKDFKDKFDKNYSEDYIGKYEDILSLGDKDRANKVHEMVNDRNGILILSKNANIDLSEAAKKYFEGSPEKLDKYSKKMQDVILGVDENASFDMKKLESIIGYHNKIVMNRTKRIMENSEKNANRFIKTSAQVENHVKYKRNLIRHKILPLFEEINPNYLNNIETSPLGFISDHTRRSASPNLSLQ